MVTSFDISQEIISIDMLTALKSSLKHRRKHVLRSLQLYRDQILMISQIIERNGQQQSKPIVSYKQSWYLKDNTFVA